MAPDPPGFFPPAQCIPPLQSPHKQTFILLHGRGLSAHIFGPDLLSTTFSMTGDKVQYDDDDGEPLLSPVPSTTGTQSDRAVVTTTTTTTIPTTSPTLREAFPHAKFTLPLAPRHRATIYKRSLIHQWCDSWDPSGTSSASSKEEWRAAPGLRDTVSHLHGLTRAEAETLGGRTGNIVLGRLSQGCAAALAALLLWDGPPLMGFWGMCDWLFFEGDVKAVLGLSGPGDDGAGGEEEFDPFEREVDEKGRGVCEEEGCMETRVVRALRERLELEEGDGRGLRSRPGSFDTPVFLGHGVEDDKVPVVRGREAAECLRAAGLDAEWREYHGLGHWYSDEMFSDMVSFLKDRAD
ncbi:Alpha/Beta hydrolase protein [Achaetomium macrosporum]|uniref:Alpha/Beta hydrolase protein n=1 Tax=Achaetomium macrosporum TaxID=79813 RepID=A0AAN7HH26_9PEZI|nr:Alpha/Beta hydrolase protein [Achaetomium macrosporum]